MLFLLFFLLSHDGVNFCVCEGDEAWDGVRGCGGVFEVDEGNPFGVAGILIAKDGVLACQKDFFGFEGFKPFGLCALKPFLTASS